MLIFNLVIYMKKENTELVFDKIKCYTIKAK